MAMPEPFFPLLGTGKPPLVDSSLEMQKIYDKLISTLVLQDSLRQCLQRTADFEATQPLDRIYSILHLARCRLSADLEVDYSNEPSDLMWTLMQHSVNVRQDLDLMSMCHLDRALDRCSWLPDLVVGGSTPLPSIFGDCLDIESRAGTKADIHWLSF